MQGIQDIAREDGALLCFDEVMTGFRIAKGCAQEYFGVTPDLTTLGKVIGGGLPVGAYGGRADIMKMVAPSGPMYQVQTSLLDFFTHLCTVDPNSGGLTLIQELRQQTKEVTSRLWQEVTASHKIISPHVHPSLC